MKFYTIKLPNFLGGIVRAMIGAFKKNRIETINNLWHRDILIMGAFYFTVFGRIL